MANEKRLIDAYAFEEYHCNGCPYRREGSCTSDDPICATIDDLREAPTVDAVEVVHGRWIGMEEEIWGRNVSMVTMWQCSACGVSQTTLFGRSNYCPNCGADMRERKDNDR